METITRPVMNYPADLIDRPDTPIEETNTATSGTRVDSPNSFMKTSFESILQIIKSDTHKQKITAIRNANTPDIAKKIKFSLPWFSLNRFRGGRRNVNLTQANGMILDYDHIDNAEELKKSIIPKIDYVRFAFTSPSGGLKVGIRFAQPLFREPDYKMVYLYLQKKLDALLGITSDATPDPARATFFSYDPALYDNPGAVAIDTEELLNRCINEEVQKVSQSGNAITGKQQIDNLVYNTKIIVTDAVVKDVETCMSFLVKIKIEYYDWIKIGMALYSGFGDAGKKYWDMFYNNPNYYYETQLNLDKHWKSFSQVRNITLASLFYVAEQYGWINPNPPSSPAPQGVTQNSILLETGIGNACQNDSRSGLTVPTPNRLPIRDTKKLEDYPELVELFGKPANVELNLDMLPDVLKDYLAFTDTITDAQPGAKLTSILPCISANIGNRVFMVNNSARIFSHIWGIIIGPSSISRKTTVIKLAKQTLEPYEETLNEHSSDDYIKKTLIMTDVTMSKLLQMLSENPNRVFIQMEVSAWMRQMNRHWNAGMKQALTDLFDGVDKTIANMDRTERIRKPAFSIIAASTEGWFFQEMKDVADQQSGFLQRFLFCLIQNVNVNEIDLSYREGEESCPELRDYEEMYSVFRNIPGHHKLSIDDEAKELRNDRYKEKFEGIVKLKNDVLMSYFARIYDGYFFKFCIIFTLLKHWKELKEAGTEKESVKQFFENVKVDVETVEQVFLLCDYYFENTKPLLDSLAENNKLQNERKLVNLLYKTYNGTVSHSSLFNRSHLNKREFKEAIESLIERNAVSVTTHPSKNQYQAKVYVLSQGILQSWQSTSSQ